DGRCREHHATHFVEMTGDEIERLHEPRGERAMPLRAEPDPAVTRGPRRSREAAREPTRDLRGHARPAGDALRRELTHERREGIDILHPALETPQAYPSLREDHVEHRRQKEGVGSGPDGDVLISDLRRLG